MSALRQKLLDGLDALDRQDTVGYLDAILWLQYYAKDYGVEKAVLLLDDVGCEWSLARNCCACCGERGTYHDPRG